MATAIARHILVSDQQQCEEIKAQIQAGSGFAELAQQYSLCPSGSRGGDLGEFSPGMMVKEFDDIVFNEAVGQVHGPVQTQFGYHLIEITQRSD